MAKPRCKFGRPHTWSVWYENGKLVKDENTLHCFTCGETSLAN